MILFTYSNFFLFIYDNFKLANKYQADGVLLSSSYKKIGNIFQVFDQFVELRQRKGGLMLSERTW